MKEGFLIKANWLVYRKKVSFPRIPILGNTRLNRSVSADLLLYSHAAAFATI